MLIRFVTQDTFAGFISLAREFFARFGDAHAMIFSETSNVRRGHDDAGVRAAIRRAFQTIVTFIISHKNSPLFAPFLSHHLSGRQRQTREVGKTRRNSTTLYAPPRRMKFFASTGID
jgi:hypothetical protein